MVVAAEARLRRDLRKGEVERDSESGDVGGEDGREAEGDGGEERSEEGFTWPEEAARCDWR